MKLTEQLPGAEAADAPLLQALAAASLTKPRDYQPRTRHRREDGGPRYTNRLFLETSPYLAQHAHNPVNWYPWGDEAFAAARRLGRPVLLSIGYSTCHWCHVMEEESFEDEGIAAAINANYIPVKVDREERPDVDQIYMTAVQALTGHGGWPMTVWLTDDRRPYYAGTYFPPRDGARGARVGFLTLLEQLSRLAGEDPERVARAASELAGVVERQLRGQDPGAAPDAALLDEAYRLYEGNFDPDYGGLGQAPKFPATLPIRWLYQYHARTGQPQARAMADLTLERMAAGGLRDHLGGGFHRYSVDDEWLVPHFEKMLYDQALLVQAYLEGHQATGRADFAAVARETLDYVARELRSPAGGFYAATDADSPNPERGGEREEGWFFTWTPAELVELLGDEDARRVGAYFAVTPGGNFEGRSILHTPRPAATVAAALGIGVDTLLATVATAKPRLYAARARRPQPHLDDKVLTAWNGLMISAFAKAALVLNEPRYAAIAAAAAAAVLAPFVTSGRLSRTCTGGVARGPAFLDDYAFLMQGLLDLYEASFDFSALKSAVALEAVTAAHFADRERGGYFLTADDHETLLVREKPAYDGATPSGNSIMAQQLLRLATLTTEARYRRTAERTMQAFHGTFARAPGALAEMLIAAEYAGGTPLQIAVVARQNLDEAAPYLNVLRRQYLPHRVLTGTTEADRAAAAALVPLLRDRPAGRDGPAVYVCRGESCSLPALTPDALAQELQRPEAGA